MGREIGRGMIRVLVGLIIGALIGALGLELGVLASLASGARLFQQQWLLGLVGGFAVLGALGSLLLWTMDRVESPGSRAQPPGRILRRIGVGLAVWLGLVVLLAAAFALFTRPCRAVAGGLLNGERFYEGRPLSFWVDALHDPKGDQDFALEALGVIGGPEAAEAVPALIEMLRQENIPAGVWKALQMIGPAARDAGVGLVKILQDPQRKQDHARAEQTLAAIGAEDADISRAVTLVRGGLHSKSAYVRKNAARTLGAIGPAARAAVPDLLKALKDESPDVRLQVARTLVRLHPPSGREAIGVLVAIFAQQSPERNDQAVEILGQIGEAGVPALSEALADQSPPVRAGAARSLGKIGPPARRAVPGLTAALKDPEESVRAAAAEALGQIGPLARKAVPGLLARLKDEKPFVRMKAAGALWEVDRRTRETIPVLIQALAGDREKYEADRTLGRMGEAAVTPLVQALGDKNFIVRRGAIETLGHIGPAAEPAVPVLRAALHVGQTREAATRALGAIGPGAAAAVPDLAPGLNDPGWGVRVATAVALGRIGPEARAAIPALREALESTDYLLPSEAEKALAKIDPRSPWQPAAIVAGFGLALFALVVPCAWIRWRRGLRAGRFRPGGEEFGAAAPAAGGPTTDRPQLPDPAAFSWKAIQAGPEQAAEVENRVEQFRRQAHLWGRVRVGLLLVLAGHLLPLAVLLFWMVCLLLRPDLFSLERYLHGTLLGGEILILTGLAFCLAVPLVVARRLVLASLLLAGMVPAFALAAGTLHLLGHEAVVEQFATQRVVLYWLVLCAGLSRLVFLLFLGVMAGALGEVYLFRSIKHLLILWGPALAAGVALMFVARFFTGLIGVVMFLWFLGVIQQSGRAIGRRLARVKNVFLRQVAPRDLFPDGR
jgi:HEAT repeat protein